MSSIIQSSNSQSSNKDNNFGNLDQSDVTHVLKLLPKCRLNENWEIIVDAPDTCIEEINFELKNRIMLDLPITTLPIPKDNLTTRRKEIIKKFNLKQRDLPSSVRDPPNQTCTPTKKAKIIPQVLDNTLLNSSFNVDENWDKIQESIVGKKSYADKVKEKIKSKRNNDKKQNFKTANKHKNKLQTKPSKDQSPLERWKTLEKSKSPIFRYNIHKWTPVWKQERVSGKEATDNWPKATKELKIAARLLKSYDNVKIDLDGMKIDNIIKINRARNKTSSVVDRIKKLISQRNSHNKKDKANANYKLRKIVQFCKMKRNDKKMENIEQILHFNSERIKNLNKRIDIVQKKNDDNKIRFNFKSKPSLKSLKLDKNHKTDIPNETIEEYLTDLFKEEDTKKTGY